MEKIIIILPKLIYIYISELEKLGVVGHPYFWPRDGSGHPLWLARGLPTTLWLARGWLDHPCLAIPTPPPKKKVLGGLAFRVAKPHVKVIRVGSAI
jgi:hypothetical protein